MTLVAFIPPFSAVVLERSATPDDVLREVLNIRDEYSKLRERLTELESERIQAKSIADRRKLRQKQRKLLDAAAQAFDRPHTLTLEAIIRYVPEVVKTSTAPFDPTKYSASLLLQPVEWLVKWWQLRPISKIFNLTAEIGRIEEYAGLAEKVFGERAKAIGEIEIG